ncbi:MAG: hypothetical protein FVQ82_15885 [Planctomycetes bacterium]|nr:hypothetical protein [Planctomycetota bacterium]
MGNVTEYEYDYQNEPLYGTAIGNLMKIKYPAVPVDGETVLRHPVVEFTYNSSGQVTSITSEKWFDAGSTPAGTVITYDYYNDPASVDNFGRLHNVTVDSAGTGNLSITTEYAYDSLGNANVVSVDTGDLNISTDYLYSELNKLIKVTAPKLLSETSGYITQMSYTKNKKLKQVQSQHGAVFGDADDQIVKYEEYTILDKIQKLTDSLGNSTNYLYDYNDKLKTVTDAESKETDYVYNERGLLDSVTDAEGATTQYRYDKNGNLKELEDAKNQVTTYDYDGFGRLETVTYPQNEATVNTTEKFGYNKNGNLISRETRAGDFIYFQYDAMNRQTSKAVYAAGDTDVVTIDNGAAAGNWTSSTSGSGFYGTDYLTTTTSDTYTFDTPVALNGKYMILMTWPQGADDDVTVTIYNTAGDSVTIDQTANYGKWNVLGTYEFNVAQDAGVIDISGQSGLSTIADAVRLVPADTYSYDIGGRVTEVDDFDFADPTEFDTSTDRLGRVKQVQDQYGKTVDYDYDNLSRRTSLVYPDNNTELTYGYDEMSRLTDIYYDNGTTTVRMASYEYDRLSRRIHSKFYEYATNYYLSEAVYYYQKNATTGHEVGNRLEGISNIIFGQVLSSDYTYDKVGNRLTESWDGGTTDERTYLYDNVYRLTDVDYAGGGSIDYHDDLGSGEEYFDLLGNWQWQVIDGGTPKQYSTGTNELNQYTIADEKYYYYDDNGNMKGIDSDGLDIPANGYDIATYNHDPENRLVEVKGSAGTVIATYAYDYAGRRISKTVSGVTTRYVYDGARVIAEYDDHVTTGTFALVRKFIYGPGIDEPVCMINVDTGGNETLYFYHYDGLGSVIALSNDSGTIVQQYTYDPFGITTITTTTGYTTPNNPYMYTARRYDPESELYYYRARYYKPELGRFLQPDPKGYADGMNIYTYCGNNPTNYIDPWGLEKQNFWTDDGYINPSQIKDGIVNLTDEVIQQEMRRFREDPDYWPRDLIHMKVADTRFKGYEGKRLKFTYNEEYYTAEEVNYIGVGMGAYYNRIPFPSSLANLWNLQYGHLATPGERFWMRYGYRYQRANTCRKPLKLFIPVMNTFITIR